MPAHFAHANPAGKEKPAGFRRRALKSFFYAPLIHHSRTAQNSSGAILH
jgi:hypothetical protein